MSDPFLSSKVRESVCDVLLTVKQARLVELNKLYLEFQSFNISQILLLEIKLTEAEIESLKTELSKRRGPIGPF